MTRPITRPAILFPYFSTLSALKGIGSKTLMRLNKLCGETVVELLFHLPREVIDRRRWSVIHADSSSGLHPGLVTLAVSIEAHRGGAKRPQRGRKIPHTIATIITEPGLEAQHIALNIVYFHTSADYLREQYPTGSTRLVSGTLERRRGEWVILHPEYNLAVSEGAKIPDFEPRYPLTQGLSNRLMHKAIQQALEIVPALDEWHREETLARWALPPFDAALRQVHSPPQADDLPSGASPAIRRLALDELLAQQLSLQLLRERHQRQYGLALPQYNNLRDKLTASLPFTLSETQQNALDQIRHDLQQPTAMLRLLMGDVGSGKTTCPNHQRHAASSRH